MYDGRRSAEHECGEYGGKATGVRSTSRVCVHAARLVRHVLCSPLRSCWETGDRAEPVFEVDIASPARLVGLLCICSSHSCWETEKSANPS